jgi:hypothetical protein
MSKLHFAITPDNRIAEINPGCLALSLSIWAVRFIPVFTNPATRKPMRKGSART